ncbi:MAG: alpha/beta hydrolase [Spongiibacteraceae bacterium]|nr:alpha/beta hydrolase [Spongiibacteraceae bacterium]
MIGQRNNFSCRNFIRISAGAALALGGALSLSCQAAVNGDGSTAVQAFQLPVSALRSAASLQAPLKASYNSDFGEILKQKNCHEGADKDLAAQKKAEACMLGVYYKAKIYTDLASRYKAAIENSVIAGVQVAVVTPVGGIAPENKARVLIDLHGGTMKWGAVHELVMNAVPMAAVGRVKVISIDYAKAPAHRFPAASKDVAAVYRELLKTYKPENIGLYGCAIPSLVGGAMAWFVEEGLPLPGAAAMLCGGAGPLDGDSMHIISAVDGHDYAAIFQNAFTGPGAYFEQAGMASPLVRPGMSGEVMKQFPPTLLAGGSRGFLLSSALHTHRQLIRLGVEASLHVWEGMESGFHQEPLRPETRQLHKVLAKFFNKHLAR